MRVFQRNDAFTRCVNERYLPDDAPEEEDDDMDNAVSADLIVVRQLPEIEERLRTVKDTVDKRTAAALAMVCTEETIQAVKAERAKLNQEFAILEDQRKAAKKAVMEPYERFEAVYKECVSDAFRQADIALKEKISSVESEMKRRCEDGLRDYFDELCAVHHLDWLTYERANIKIDMASAKAKTPSKLRKQLVEFVTDVAESVERINALDDAGEIMVEYQRTLNAADAICAVQERHRRIEEQKAAQEARKAVLDREAEAVRRVETIAPPVEVKQEKVLFMDFRAHGTLAQLKILKQFAAANGIKLEGIKHE